MSLWGIIKSGDVIGAVKKVIALCEGEVQTLETQFPFLADAINSFETDFGKAVLADAEAFGIAVLADPASFVTQATALMDKVIADGVTAGEDALKVSMNGLRMFVIGAQASATATAAAVPEAAATAAPAA